MDWENLYKGLSSEFEHKIFLAIHLPVKRKEKRQFIINQIWTAKRMGFSSRCIIRVCCEVYKLSRSTVKKYKI